MSQTFLFTPRNGEGKRMSMRVNLADRNKVEAQADDMGIIVDQATGERWHAYRADCGLGCRCDALVEPIHLKAV